MADWRGLSSAEYVEGPWMYQATLAGFLLGFSLILAIGAQNAFVLRQGLRRQHVALVVAICRDRMRS